MITVAERAIAKERARARDFPEPWRQRLREVSPDWSGTSFLVPRWMGGPEQWVLYQAVPDLRIPAERRVQLQTYWADLPLGLQAGRRQMVSDYQYMMYHDHRLDVRPFLVLQGDHGGTPARYTTHERHLLQSQQLPDRPPPVGSLRYAPFDERTVHAILLRDRLLQVGQSLEALHGLDSVAGQKRTQADEDRISRTALLAWWREEMGPIAERMQSILRTPEGQALRRPTAPETRGAHEFADQFLATGEVPAPLPTVAHG